MSTTDDSSNIRIEPATLEDLPALTKLVQDLAAQDPNYLPNRDKQLRGLKLIVEQPNRGRIFVIRSPHMILGMINLLFTINIAEGGFVIILEDLVIHHEHRLQGYGNQLLKYALNFAKEKGFLRITLLASELNASTRAFFANHGFFEPQLVPMRLILNSPPSDDPTNV